VERRLAYPVKGKTQETERKIRRVEEEKVAHAVQPQKAQQQE